MKKIFVSFILIMSTMFTTVHAASVSSQPIKVAYAGQLSNTSYLNIYPSMLKAVKAISISHGGSTPIVLAIGATGSEVDQLVIPPFQSTPMIYPMVASGFQQVSIKALSSAVAETGSGYFNFIFN